MTMAVPDHCFFICFSRQNTCFSSFQQTSPKVIKKIFMISSAEYEILNAHKYKNIKKFSFLQAQISQ